MNARSLRCLAVALIAAAVWSMTAVAQQSPDDTGRAILDDPTRPRLEHERDMGTHPLEVYAWLGIRPGLTVGDLIPAAGYNSHLLAHVVGDSGHVLAAYTSEFGARRLQRRFRAAGIHNITIVRDLHHVPSASIDVFVTVRNVHDLFIPEAARELGVDRNRLVQEVYRVLKPGGILGVVDARTPRPGVDEHAHRINEQTVIDWLTGQGFELIDRSDLLSVPDDDFEAGGYPTRWNVDRLLLKFRKAER